LQCAGNTTTPRSAGYLNDRQQQPTLPDLGNHEAERELTGLNRVTTLLDKTLKREVRVQGRSYIVSLSPLALKLTPKGKRKGLELAWDALVSGDAALAAALNASVARLTPQTLAPAPRGRSPRQRGGRKSRL
jgi:hypothetical protein